MERITRIFGGGVPAGLAEPLRGAVEAWLALPASDLDAPHFHTRYVVVGLAESTGALPRLAALGVSGGQLALADAFAVDFSRRQEEGEEAVRAGLVDLLGFLGRSPLVAYQSSFAAAMLQRLFEDYLKFEPRFQWLDLARILPELWREVDLDAAGVQEWLAVFGLPAVAPGDAFGDAAGVARLLLGILARGGQRGAESARSLIDLEKARRWLRAN
jgi:DNA polymerase III subunit epsilon